MELEAIGETCTNAQKKRKILFNLFDMSLKTQVIISWCERHCATFAEVVAHLTDTSIHVSNYNGRHAVHQAKQAQCLTPVEDYDEDNDDFRTLLQAICDHQQLSDIVVTKFILLDNQGVILLQHNKGVYNKDSCMTLFSEFQLCTHGCINDSTYKRHHGADYQAGTQRIVTPDDEDSMPYTIPLHLHDALMIFTITMPTVEDLATLPIADLTPDGIWTPSDFNEN